MRKISIIIPFYQVEEYIAECLDSVIRQDYSELEIILVDDCSSDKSRVIAESFAAHDSRISILTHEINQGLGPARNTGVLHASGDYLLFLDSDDYLLSNNSVSTMFKEAEATGCRVVIGSCRLLKTSGELAEIDRDHVELFKENQTITIDGKSAFLGSLWIPGGQYVPMRAWGILIDRAFYLETNLSFPPGRHEDMAVVPFLFYLSGQVRFLSYTVLIYRQRSCGLSNSPWHTDDIYYYGKIWQYIWHNLELYCPEVCWGDTAISIAKHLIWRINQNGLNPGAEKALIEVLQRIFSYAKGNLNELLFYETMDGLIAINRLNQLNNNVYKLLSKDLDSQLVNNYNNKIIFHKLKGELVKNPIARLLLRFPYRLLKAVSKKLQLN